MTIPSRYRILSIDRNELGRHADYNKLSQMGPVPGPTVGKMGESCGFVGEVGDNNFYFIIPRENTGEIIDYLLDEQSSVDNIRISRFINSNLPEKLRETGRKIGRSLGLEGFAEDSTEN